MRWAVELSAEVKAGYFGLRPADRAVVDRVIGLLVVRGMMGDVSAGTPWEQVRDESLAAMTTEEWAEYDAASVEAEARLQLAELVYNARTRAGLSQTELARRAGTRQSTISAIENGAHAPGGVMLTRIANAVDATLAINMAA